MSILAVILGILAAWLAWRLAAVRRSARHLAEAAERGDPLLLEHGNGLGRLARALNRLVEERADISDTGRGHLERIRTTLENLREAVVMVDRGNRIRMANPAFAELADTPDSPLGQRLDVLLEGAAFREFMEDVRRGGVGQRREIAVRQMKRERWLEASAANLPDSPGENGPLTLFFLHDVTRQKRLESMRTEFVANLSHELRTPVTIIKGYAETLLEDEAVLSREERMRFLEKIRAGAERQNRLLEDLLLLSRLESADMSMEMERICLEDLLGGVVSSWKPVVEQRGREIVSRFEVGNATVLADPFRLGQVMDNLIENVLRHAAGFTRIVVGTEAVDGDRVRIVVEDDGPGIPEKDRPHIFQRFYRVEKGRSREQGGTGLGLSIVKHIVGGHEGSIAAVDRPGGGTRIEIILSRAVTGPVPSD